MAQGLEAERGQRLRHVAFHGILHGMVPMVGGAVAGMDREGELLGVEQGTLDDRESRLGEDVEHGAQRPSTDEDGACEERQS